MDHKGKSTFFRFIFDFSGTLAIEFIIFSLCNLWPTFPIFVLFTTAVVILAIISDSHYS